MILLNAKTSEDFPAHTAHTHRFAVLKEGHVIATHRAHKQHCTHVIKTRDPLSSLRPLTSNVHHSEENQTKKN